MSATIIDGKAFAATVREKVAGHVAALKEVHGIVPGLAVVLVGEDPASQVYVRSKGKQTVEVGMNSFEHKLEASTSQEELLAVIEKLNADPAVHAVHRAARTVSREIHRFKGLLRFRRLQDGLYWAPFEPDYDIISTLAPHFRARLADQRSSLRKGFCR